MDLRQLEYLVAVAEEGSFTRAAERVHVSQPGVSAQVRRLEAELGQELLDRTGRAVRLTTAGAAVLPHARAALEAAAEVREEVDRLAGLVRGAVALGAVYGCGALDVPGMLAEFHAAHPGVDIRLVEDASDRLLADVLAAQLDLAIVGLAGDAPAGIATHTLVHEPFVAAVAPDHALAGRRSMRIRALRDVPLISMPRGTGMRSALEAACAAAGVTPRIAFETGDPAVLMRLAGRGLGVGILPASAIAASEGALVGVALTAPQPSGSLSLAWREGGPSAAAARALLDHARDRLAA
ncbi:LysR family transcriptional regulator [Conexibacter sp. SYSU D00693]|uniref:LysR family transcriptional regulator n=1 Tax=Conexibacter sp. SYSU D00693 TaxID=2812560 RepID=UPI00196B85CE|nr:LysR family transcriptional regulator [Conexibacter sp. SYSU D00693]